MSGTGRFGSAVETMVMIALGLAGLYAALLPYSLAAERLPAPDLVYCLIAAWVIRRPAGAPLWVLIGFGLVADLLLSRPIGLGALGLLVAAEALRSYAAPLRHGSFAVEWLAVSAVFGLMVAAMHLALQLVFMDGPGPGALLRHAAVTALAYPAVVIVLNVGLGMSAPRRAPGSERLGRIA